MGKPRLRPEGVLVALHHVRQGQNVKVTVVELLEAFTKLMGAFGDNDAGSKIHLLANPGRTWPPSARLARNVLDLEVGA